LSIPVLQPPVSAGARGASSPSPPHTDGSSLFDDEARIVEENLMYDLVTFLKQIGLSD
jgi:hypothetical protein